MVYEIVTQMLLNTARKIYVTFNFWRMPQFGYV